MNCIPSCLGQPLLGSTPTAPTTPKSASASKIALDNNNNATSVQDVSVSGFILMDVKVLCDYLNGVVTCPICQNCLKVRGLFSRAQGFAVQFVGLCEECSCDHKLFTTSPECSKTGIREPEQ